MKPLLVLSLVLTLFGLGSAFSKEVVISYHSTGFEMDGFKNPGPLSLLAQTQMSSKIFKKGTQWKVCTLSRPGQLKCGLTFELDQEAQVYEANADVKIRNTSKGSVEKEVNLDKKSSVIEIIRKEDFGSLTIRGALAVEIFEKYLTKADRKIDETLDYKKEVRQGIDGQCLKIQLASGKKYSCTLRLAETFLP